MIAREHSLPARGAIFVALGCAAHVAGCTGSPFSLEDADGGASPPQPDVSSMEDAPSA